MAATARLAVHVGGMTSRSASKGTVQVTFRLPEAWLADADEVAKLLARPGMEASRTDALRAAIVRGLEVLRAELAPAPTTPKKPKR